MGCPEAAIGTDLLPMNVLTGEFIRFGNSTEYTCPDGKRFDTDVDDFKLSAKCEKKEEDSFEWNPSNGWPHCVHSKHFSIEGKL